MVSASEKVSLITLIIFWFLQKTPWSYRNSLDFTLLTNICKITLSMNLKEIGSSEFTKMFPDVYWHSAVIHYIRNLIFPNKNIDYHLLLLFLSNHNESISQSIGIFIWKDRHHTAMSLRTNIFFVRVNFPASNTMEQSTSHTSGNKGTVYPSSSFFSKASSLSTLEPADDHRLTKNKPQFLQNFNISEIQQIRIKKRLLGFKKSPQQ